MPFITEGKHWYIFYAIIWLYLVIKGGAKGRAAAIMILVLIFCTDQTSNFLKEFFGRMRPCKVLPDVNLLVGCASAYSFPSNHAVNNFAAATMFTYFYPQMKYALFIGAFLVSISRVFCGVHYPFDIVGGALIGILIALLLVYIWKQVNNKLHLVKS